jgi:hypothetical protein
MINTEYINSTNRYFRISKNILIIGTLFLLSFSCNNDPDVILEKGFLEDKFLKFKVKNPLNDSAKTNDAYKVILEVFPEIFLDSNFVDSTGTLLGFEYNLGSANTGIAKIVTDSNLVTDIRFYRQMDISLYRTYKPSFNIYFEKKNKSFLIFDSYYNTFRKK